MLLFFGGGGWGRGEGGGGEGEISMITHKLEGFKEKKEKQQGDGTRSDCVSRRKKKKKCLYVRLVYVLEKLVRVP